MSFCSFSVLLLKLVYLAHKRDFSHKFYMNDENIFSGIPTQDILTEN